MWYEINEWLQFCIAVLGFFLFFLFLQKRESGSNIWLGVLNLLLAVHFCNLLLLPKFEISNFGMVFGLMYGPIIFNFVRSHTAEVKLKVIFHFIPAFLLLVWILTIDYQRGITPRIELEILRIIVFIHLVSYLVLANRLAQKFKSIAIQTRSKIAEDRIRLIGTSILTISVIFIFVLAESYFGFYDAKIASRISIFIISAIVLFAMLGIIYYAIENPFVFNTLSKNEKDLAFEVRSQYQSSGLTKEKSEEYLATLLLIMDQNKPFQNSDLSIGELSKATKIPSRYLSQIINQQLNQNFFDFINSYRIEEAKEKLTDRDKRISEVMYEVGFSSRSSFNTAFRKYTGESPSQFRRKI